MFGKIGTGCGRLWYWTILRWEILLLDFFAVGDCGTGLFCCGRFYCWTFLLWEILMLDFLASGPMNCTALMNTTFISTKYLTFQNLRTIGTGLGKIRDQRIEIVFTTIMKFPRSWLSNIDFETIKLVFPWVNRYFEVWIVIIFQCFPIAANIRKKYRKYGPLKLRT